MEAADTSQLGRDWSSLSADLLREILAWLPWSSHASFAATCAHWRSAVDPFYPAWITPVLLNAADVGSTNIRFYSPYYHKIFELEGETLKSPGAKICCAGGHHVMLLYRKDKENIVVDANLVTGVIYDMYVPKGTSFNFVVYDGKQRMFGVSGLFMLQAARSVRPGGDDGQGWCRWQFSDIMTQEGPPEFTVSPTTNPVLHRGLLYLLRIDGSLAVYDDSRPEEGFEVLDMPKGFGFECDDYYLFESDEGELMAVLMGRCGPPVHVVKLNEQSMEWEKVESLKGRALFTGTLATLMVKTNVKWMHDKIFTPRLYDWPETIRVDLVDREGELAFIPISNEVPQHGGVCGTSIWACGLGPHEGSAKFWETIKLDYSIWMDFST